MNIQRPALGVLATALLASSIALPAAAAELVLPRTSPKATVTQTIGLTDVTLTFSRPGVKGRKIWGDLVPYGEAWRTGANEATLLTVSTDATFGGQKLPAGSYSLYTIPAKDEWTVVVNKEKDAWGEQPKKPEQDVLRFKVKPATAPQQEWLSFGFEKLSTNSAELVLRWEKLMLPMTIEVDAVNLALANARAAIAEAKPDDWRTHFRSADFAFNAGVNEEEAMKWATESITREETYLNLSLMAKMKAKAGDTKEAVVYAEKAIKAGKASKDPVDTRPTEKLLAEWSGKK